MLSFCFILLIFSYIIKSIAQKEGMCLMIYQKIKEKLVDEEKVLTSKQLIKLTVRLGLIVGGTAMMLGLLASCTMGMGVALFVLIGGVAAYAWFFDMFAESPDSAAKFLKLSKLWPIIIVLFVAEYLALRLFNFI